MRPAKLLFWASSALILHTHVGYPALLWLLARDRREPEPPTPGATPRVSVVVAAHEAGGGGGARRGEGARGKGRALALARFPARAARADRPLRWQRGRNGRARAGRRRR